MLAWSDVAPCANVPSIEVPAGEYLLGQYVKIHLLSGREVLAREYLSKAGSLPL